MSYPEIPDGAKTGLLLFGAAFEGANDGVFLAEAGLSCDVVDKSPERLAAMKKRFPRWRYVEADAFDFGRRALLADKTWDVVSVDPFTGEADHVYSMLKAWKRLAAKLVVVGVRTFKAVPEGWRSLPRSSSWAWLYQ